ncbi:MAG: hypothetical protein HQK63_15070 [Desulfamplus sp.]|nr:hypothetical protein [Desulfamplus sp.]
MKNFFAFIVLFAISGTAVAGSPTYLDCLFSENRLFKVTINEYNNTVTIDYSTGLIRTYQAIFSANEVKFVDVDDSSGGIATSIFTINRTTLKMNREIPSISSTDEGQCSLVKAPPSRKF